MLGMINQNFHLPSQAQYFGNGNVTPQMMAMQQVGPCLCRRTGTYLTMFRLRLPQQMYTQQNVMNTAVPQALSGFVQPPGMTLVSNAELAAIRSELVEVRTLAQSAHSELDALRTSMASSQLLATTVSDSVNGSSTVAVSDNPVTKTKKTKKRDSDLTVSRCLPAIRTPEHC